MRWPHFVLLQCLLLVIAGSLGYIHKDRVAIIKKPPESLAQWYKPDNKRQVWLHTMFSLRREMQAANYYSSNSDALQLEKWANRFSEHYLKIGEMVPEWKNKLNNEAVAKLQESVKSNHFEGATLALEELSSSCDSCHNDYRVITAALYRAPDFSSVDITPSVSFNSHMRALTQQVNQIKISAEEGMREAALASFSELSEGITALGEVCSDCHKKDTKAFPNEAINKTMARLEESLKTGSLKQQGRELGTLAVQACARCHGTHRLAYDLRETFSSQPNWLELIKH